MSEQGNDRDLAYSTGRWDRYRWERFVEESGDEARAMLANAKRRNVNAPALAREIFARLCGDPTREAHVRPEDAWASAIHSEIESSPDFGRLAHDCAGDRLSAGQATITIMSAILDRVPRLDTDPESVREQVRSLLDFAKTHGSTPEIAAQLDALKMQGKAIVARAVDASNAIDADGMGCAIVEGIESARAHVDSSEEQIEALGGWSAGSFGEPSTLSDGERATLARAIRSSDRLRRIAELAGRLKRIAAEKQRTKADHARNEISDIEQGNDLERVLPSELVQLASGSPLALDFARRYVERSLLQYRIDGREEQGRGPIVVCVDQSSSMDGMRDVWAKAFALALAQVASIQKREIAIILFNGAVISETRWKGAPDTAELMRVLDRGPYGGTSFGPPADRALALIKADERLKKADVVFITDGEGDLDVEAWNRERKAVEASCYGIQIGYDSAHTLRAMADQVVTITDIANDIDALTVLEI